MSTVTGSPSTASSVASSIDVEQAPRESGQRTRPATALWLVLVATSLPMFLATLDNLVMTTALPVIQRDLDATVGQLLVVPQRLHAGLRRLHAAGGDDR